MSAHRRLTSVLTVLAYVAESDSPRSVSDIARSTGLTTSTSSRIAAELADHGLLTRCGRSPGYDLGDRAFALAGAAARHYYPGLQVSIGRLSMLGETACVVAPLAPGSASGRFRVIFSAPGAWTLTAAAEPGLTLADSSGALARGLGTPVDLGGTRRVYRGRTPGGVVDRLVPIRGDGPMPFAGMMIRVPEFRDNDGAMLDAGLRIQGAYLEQAILDGDPARPNSRGEESARGDTALELCVRLLHEVVRDPRSPVRVLAERTGCRVERARRILESATAVGLVEGPPALAGYRATLRLGGWYTVRIRPRLTAVANRELRVPAALGPISAYLTALVGARSVTLAEVLSRGELATTSWLGRPFPLSGSAGAPALISGVSDDIVEEVFVYTPRSKARGMPRTVAGFLAVVDELRAEGSVVVREHGENGITSVSAPVWGLAGEVAGAVCLVGPTRDIEARADRLRAEATAVAARITRGLTSSPEG
ncbi:MarR family transcriptional regulator [Nocardia sp. NPDC058176]|uniref:IclR family transcriptional regulator domain-containing protein n=1 Tax=Nocardia sp. NPDC058176 TaxID=3346368 RepID=UPI0036D99373